MRAATFSKATVSTGMSAGGLVRTHYIIIDRSSRNTCRNRKEDAPDRRGGQGGGGADVVRGLTNSHMPAHRGRDKSLRTRLKHPP